VRQRRATRGAVETGETRDIGMELGCIIGKRRDHGRERFYRAARARVRAYSFVRAMQVLPEGFD
jgi:hypothetical protein